MIDRDPFVAATKRTKTFANQGFCHGLEIILVCLGHLAMASHGSIFNLIVLEYASAGLPNSLFMDS